MEKLQVRYTLTEADLVAEALYDQAQSADVSEDAIVLEAQAARLRNMAARARLRASVPAGR